MEFYIRAGTNNLYVDIGKEDIELALAEPGIWHTTSGTSWIFLKHRFPFLRFKFYKLIRWLKGW